MEPAKVTLEMNYDPEFQAVFYVLQHYKNMVKKAHGRHRADKEDVDRMRIIEKLDFKFEEV
jgi:hypothetical protein